LDRTASKQTFAMWNTSRFTSEFYKQCNEPGFRSSVTPIYKDIQISYATLMMCRRVTEEKVCFGNSECEYREVGPCHHGMARPQVADGGTASNMEGSCKYEGWNFNSGNYLFTTDTK